RVVGPLARLQPERSTAHHVGERLERARALELEGGAQGVADGQAEERAAAAVVLAASRIDQRAGSVHGHAGAASSAAFLSAASTTRSSAPSVARISFSMACAASDASSASNSSVPTSPKGTPI